MIDFTEYKTRKELEKFTETLFGQVQIFQVKIQELESKLAHSEELLKNSENIPAIEKKKPEEELLMREIYYLDKLSQQKGLDLSETKQLGILVNSLVALRKNEPTVVPKKAKMQNPQELLALIKNDDKIN